MSSPQQINPYFIKQFPGHKSVIDKICEGVTSPEELVKEVHGQDAGDLRKGILRSAEEPSDHSGGENEGRHINNRRDWHRHEPLRDGKPSFIMGRTEAPQRPVKQDCQVTAHHTRESLPETDNHPVRMGRKPSQGLLRWRWNPV